MRKPKKKQFRKINIAKIRPSHTYNREEIEKSQNRTKETVRRWIREGLPPIPGTNKQRFDGAEFKAWAIAREAERKRPCKPDQFFCMNGNCRTQRLPAVGSVFIRKTNTNLGSIEANCVSCGGAVKKGFAMKDLAETEATFESFVGNVRDLLRYRDPPSNGTSQ